MMIKTEFLTQRTQRNKGTQRNFCLNPFFQYFFVS
jgi:hypothetical protein